MIAILGPTRIGDEVLTARQRALVSTLVLHGERGVTTDVLIDAVWAGRAPATARQSLQNQVARLRSAFGDDLIVSDASGYRSGRPTDVGFFDGHADEALRRPAGPAALAPCAEALDLWTGTPYLDLTDHHPAEVERARLTAIHADVADQLAASRIVMGDTEAAARLLVELTAADPLRERRWALLLAALHASGRSIEALAAYDRACTTLVSTLGVRPSFELAQIHGEIVTGREGEEVLALLDLHPTPQRAAPACAHIRRASHLRRTCRSA